jgi:hypothetical protein
MEEAMSVAVILVATGERYEKHIAPMIASLREFFPPCTVLLFTDSKDSFDAVKIDYQRTGWPDSTMMRYHAIYEQRGRLLSFDQIYYIDVDMRVVSEIPLKDLLTSGIVAVTHPGFPDAFERRPESAAYVEKGSAYYQGCFVGGSTGAFLNMCGVIARNIDADNEKGITAVWFDESHLNRYLHDNPPGKVLTRAYAWPEGWTAIKDPKIVHLEKRDQSWKDSNKIVRGFWSGPKLTNIQKLCICSYIRQGHEFHLYVTEPTEGIPEGTVVWDANEILSTSRLSEFDNSVHFADYFRVLLILKEGGWFVDLDTVCLRRLDFTEPYVFVSEEQLGPRQAANTPVVPSSSEVQEYLSGCVFKAPKGAPILHHIASRIESMDKMHPENWISFGPALFKEAIPIFGLSKYVKAPVVLDAMRYDQILHFVTPGIEWTFTDKSYLIHLRTSAWTGDLLVPDKIYTRGCLFENLKLDNCRDTRVSIVIPVYNMKEFLMSAIDSALAQTYRNFEVIVVDDGSTDNVHTTSQHFVGSIVWIRQENRGLNSARNTGAAAATGSMLLFLDADDMLDPDYLAKTVPLMTDGVGMVSTDMQYFGLSGNRIPTANTLEQQRVSNQMPYCALIRKKAFEQAGGYSMNPDIWAYGDWDLSLDILKRGWKCAPLHEPLFKYRMRPDSMRGVAAQTHEQMCLAIRKNHPDLYPETK